MTGRRRLGLLLSSSLLAGLAVAVAAPAQAAYPVPPTPRGLPVAVEDIQPYIGQAICDPVAKPGVAAFRNLLLRTYTDSRSFGIVRDCGAGGQSEHKEGRAFDWRMSAYSSRQAGEVSALLSWLTRTDAHGNKAAMARRFGIMYMIWNKRIWKAYDPRGWQPYSGASNHTDHVHFSFGWNGARKVTSYWDKTVAPINFGPRPPAHITPVPRFENLAVVRTYGGTTLTLPTTGAVVKRVQAALKVPTDGDYGSDTTAAVARFQVDQRLPVTQRFGLAEWKALFPPPVTPFGAVDATRSALGNLLITGWAIDADVTGPIQVTAVVDGVAVQSSTAALDREDVGKAYPEYGRAHGFAFVLPASDGPHQLCLVASNAPGTPGTNSSLRCSTVSLGHNPVGALDGLTPSLGKVRVTGYALDPDSTEPVSTALTVDGVASAVTPDSATRTDIGSRWPGLGDGHGLQADLVLTEGSHTVCLSASNVPGTAGVNAALGCRTVVVPHSPTGAVELIQRRPGGVLVQGWGLDPDVAGPVQVDVLSDGAVVTAAPAIEERLVLATGWPDQGTAHGFSHVIDLPVGTHTVCPRLTNAPGTPGSDHMLPCSVVVVSHDPSGLLTALRNVANGAVLIAGHAYDPDATAITSVTPFVDGRALPAVLAGGASSAAATRWPGYGTRHAFASRLRLTPGTHRVCLSLDNLAGTPGAARQLACKTLVVSNGTGAVTSSARSGRSVSLRGWAVDPDTAVSTSVTLLVDGRARKTVLAPMARTDVLSLMPGYGRRHGWAMTTTLTSGSHRVCVQARNVRGTPGSSRTIGCRTFWVP